MSFRPLTVYVAECDCMDDTLCEEYHRKPCRATTEDDGSAIWYASTDAAKADLNAWDWLVEGEHVYCHECSRYCDECSTYRGHAAACDSIDAEAWWNDLTEAVFRAPVAGPDRRIS